MRDTIFALSSGALPSAIAVIRISGPHAGQALTMLAGAVPEPRDARLAQLCDQQGQVIDTGLVLWFPAPHSVTGEDVGELQVHGSRAVVARLLALLASMEGLRPAERGEFTRRALENGKLDLTAAEALDDLIAAETEAQRRIAQRQFAGLLGSRAADWRARAIRIAALVAADLDFIDEGDVPDDVMDRVMPQIERLRDDIRQVLDSGRHGERLREGLLVAIAGPPNVGKSSLLNRLARRDVAIVSPYAGTTRDIIEVRLDLAGYPVTLLDTAGLRDADDPVEQEGIRRARIRAADADLVLWLTDQTHKNESPVISIAGMTLWHIESKIDLSEPDRVPLLSPDHRISVVTDDGIEELIVALTAFAERFFEQADSILITRARHRLLLTEAAGALDNASAQRNEGVEFVAEEIRRAIWALGKLLGQVDVEEVLDALFQDFCIGK